MLKLSVQTLAQKNKISPIKKLILNKELRKKYSKLSKERAEIFDIKKTMKEIEDLLN